ncbi:MAG: sensor histidine kinase [Rhodospirillaceae bacterium]|nr:sensor histidine kinase [Rhodospirillaceae bacterium]
MTLEEKGKQELTFNPRARLIRTIGDRLISGPETAVIELIKNSHDADSSFVRVTIIPPLDEGHGTIIVEDDGHGMTLEDIEVRWMEPATTDKIERRQSPDGRTLLGSKGIGRFATARLGRYLDLESTALISGCPSQFQTTKIPYIDWNVFDNVRYLSDVKFKYELPEPHNFTGTRLTISGFREDWTQIRLNALHTEMRRLVSPLDQADRTDFKIYLDLSDCTKENTGFNGSEIVNGPLSQRKKNIDLHRIQPFPLLNSCDYEVSGMFTADGDFSGKITIHRGELEPREIYLSVPLAEAERPCGLVLVQLFIFDRESAAIQRSMSRAGMGKLGATKAREILDQVSGIAIYRDKFRIRPYGDSDHDWLTLDKRRVQNPSMRIGHNQVSGIVVIDDEQDSGLVERSSREGFEENGSFRRLRRLIEEILSQKVEPIRRDFREGTGIGKREPDIFKKAHTSAEMKWADGVTSSLPKDKREKARETVAQESKKLHGYLKELEEKQAVLETKVTLGLILGEVMHEGRAPIAFLYDETSRLSRWWSTLFEINEESERRRQEGVKILRGMRVSAEKLRDLLRALSPLAGGKRGVPVYYNPNEIVSSTLLLYDRRIKAGGVETSHKADLDVRDILGFKEDLSTAIANIVDNALFWLDHHQMIKPKLSFRLSTNTKGCTIDISDNGRGIPEEFKKIIFDVGFSLKASGTGLGLSIAQEALVRSNGTITLVDCEVGATFQIWVPYGD